MSRNANIFFTSLLMLALTIGASAQNEFPVGKILVENALMPVPAGPDAVAFFRADEKIPGVPVELFLIDLKTGKETRVLPGFDFREIPTFTHAWSPDGSFFVIPRKISGQWELLRYPVGSRSGEKITNLIEFRDPFTMQVLQQMQYDPELLLSVSDLAYSPSGKRLIFTFHQPMKTAIWWLEPETGRMRQATEDKVGLYGSFHPNDDLFCYTESVDKGTAGVDQDIILRSIKTGVADTLIATRDHEFAGSVSPDGKYIAYTRTVGQTNNVYICKIETRETKALTNSTDGKHCLYPRWSPDGRRIYFQGSNFKPKPVVFVREFTPF